MTNLLHVPAVKGIISNFTDITERKIHEASLAKNQLYLEMAQTIGKTGHMIFEWSPSEKEPVISWSKIFTNFTDWKNRFDRWKAINGNGTSR